MGKGLSPILINYLKQNNHIQGKKHVFKERKNKYGNPVN